MHQIHKTEGIILGSRPAGEASRRFLILTRERGLVSVFAQGVRRISSKLRPSLQEFAHVRIEMVRGREVWRLTGVSLRERFPGIFQNPPAFTIIKNTARLLKRLCPEEESNPKIFTDFLSALAVLSNARLTLIELSSTEACLVLRILHHLGYVGAPEHFAEAITSPLNRELLARMTPRRRTVVMEINRALRESHL